MPAIAQVYSIRTNAGGSGRREGRPVTARGLSLALLVLSLASSCRRATGDEALVRRLGADGAWHHCTVSGERRPPAGFPPPPPAARADDRAGPAAGALGGGVPPRGPR